MNDDTLAQKASQGQPAAQTDTKLSRITDLFFEAGMLRHTPRSGWAFLGSGNENVAEHSFRVAFMSFVLARMAGADPYKAASIGLMHDLHEARTADLNYVHQRYNSQAQRQAQTDACTGTGLESDIVGLLDEFEEKQTPEAKLAKDADQLDFIFNLKVELDKGNEFAREWLDSALLRLKTPEAKEIARECMASHHARWWYGHIDRRWWIDRKRPEEYTREEAAEPVKVGFSHWNAGTPGTDSHGFGSH